MFWLSASFKVLKHAVELKNLCRELLYLGAVHISSQALPIITATTLLF